MNQLIRFQYPSVDIERQQVTIELIHGEEVIMTVFVDLLSNEMHKTGNLERVKLTPYDLDALFAGLWANARYLLQENV